MSDVERIIWRVLRAAAILAVVGSLIQYQGNKLIFGSFCLVIFAIGYLAVRYPTQYAHFFLGIFWFVGYWLKFVFHQSFGLAYYELYGAFDATIPSSWDAVFLVVAVGGAGYVFARGLLSPLVNSLPLSEQEIEAPFWWKSCRTWFWLAAIVLVVMVVAANANFGILTRGYVAKITLPWPLGGLYAWITDIGLALLLALFSAWDRRPFGMTRGFIALCVEGALISISTLSRGIYFFHTVPVLTAEGVDAIRNEKIRPLVTLFTIWIAVGVGVPSISTFLRQYGVNAVSVAEEQLAMPQGASAIPVAKEQSALPQAESPRQRPSLAVLWGQLVTTSQILVVDRWTGLEGVMATVAYSKKDLSLLAEAAFQHRGYGTVDVYTGKISGSGFTEDSARKYHYATLAGPIGFLYFSGSLPIVFIGMAILSALISFIEVFWRALVPDRLVLSMSGLYLALVVMQLSGSIIQAAAGIVAVTLAFLAIWAGTRAFRISSVPA